MTAAFNFNLNLLCFVFIIPYSWFDSSPICIVSSILSWINWNLLRTVLNSLITCSDFQRSSSFKEVSWTVRAVLSIIISDWGPIISQRSKQPISSVQMYFCQQFKPVMSHLTINSDWVMLVGLDWAERKPAALKTGQLRLDGSERILSNTTRSVFLFLFSGEVQRPAVTISKTPPRGSVSRQLFALR